MSSCFYFACFLAFGVSLIEYYLQLHGSIFACFINEMHISYYYLHLMLLYFLIQIVERFNWRLPGYIGSGNDRFSFSHVDDVVEGHIAAMNKGRPGERYLLTGENASFRHVFDIAAIITETQKPMFNIPFLVLEAYGQVSVLFSRITGKLPLISPPVCSVVFEIAFYSYSVSVLSKPLRENSS